MININQSIGFDPCLPFYFSAVILSDFLDLHPHDCADIDLDQGFQVFLRQSSGIIFSTLECEF